MAERWKFSSFVVFGFFMSMRRLSAVRATGCGAAAGWRSSASNFGLGHGHVDFAGSSVVHMVGGVAALAGAIVLGPRIGKFTKDGKPVAIPGHHIPMAHAGTFILAFGWFGFNPARRWPAATCASASSPTNTMLAGTGRRARRRCSTCGCEFGKPDPEHDGQRHARRPGRDHRAVRVRQQRRRRCIIGVIAGVLVVVAVLFIERTLKIDDPVGAIAVHGVNGAWGVLSLGLFADGTYGDGWNGVPGTVQGPVLRRRQPVRGAVHRHADLHRLRLRRRSTSSSRSSTQSWATACRRRSNSKVSTCRRWARWRYPDFVLTQGPTAGGN